MDKLQIKKFKIMNEAKNALIKWKIFNIKARDITNKKKIRY